MPGDAIDALIPQPCPNRVALERGMPRAQSEEVIGAGAVGPMHDPRLAPEHPPKMMPSGFGRFTLPMLSDYLSPLRKDCRRNLFMG
jgi:hypothetical protein